MDDTYEIKPLETPDSAAWRLIGGGISAFNKAQAGEDHARTLCYMLYDAAGEAVGGIIAEVYWDWLYINLLFLREEVRGLGYGARLLALAEEEARRGGATRAHLDTFSFQAPDFYRKHGYEVFGELPDFPAPHTRYYMVKTL